MNKAVPVLVALSVSLAACAKPLEVNNTTYPTYGLLNENSNRSKDVCYQLSAGNVIWSIILVETIIFPLYFIGFDLWEPYRLKKGPDDLCTFDS